MNDVKNLYYKQRNIVNKSTYEKDAEELLKKGFDIIFDGVEKNKRDKFDYNHNVKCGFDTGRRTEKRFCRCLTNFSADKNKTCESCVLKNEYGRIAKDVSFEDFEVPVSSSGKDHIGEIDLIMKYDDELFGVEVKPVWNSESLLRMVCEIETYFYVLDNNEAFNIIYPDCKKAIMFMAGSEQEKQFSDSKYKYYAKNTREIIKQRGLTVFSLKILDNSIEVNKLNI